MANVTAGTDRRVQRDMRLQANVTRAEYERYMHVSEKAGLLLAEWIRRSLRSVADEDELAAAARERELRG